MPESTETSAPRDRTEPFVGVAVVLAWLLATGGLGVLAAERGDVQSAALYARSAPCPSGTRQLPAGSEPASAAQVTALACRQGLAVTMRDTTAPAVVPDHVSVEVEGTTVRVEPASSVDAQRLVGVGSGARLQAVRWRGLLTELNTPLGTVRTVDNPAAALAADRLGAVALLGMAVVLALVALGPALGRAVRRLHGVAYRLAHRPRKADQGEASAQPARPLRRAG